MNHDRSGKIVVIEDLLRVKRAERPSAEFWPQFERELRAKQLAAIVAKRPWWQLSFKRVPAWSHLRLPLGASAMLAVVATVTVHEFHAPVDERTMGQPPGLSSGSHIGLPVSNPIPSADLANASVTTESDEATLLSLEDLAVTDEHFDQRPASNSVTVGVEERSSLASDILNKSGSGAPLATMLGSDSGFESRGLPTRSPVVEPLSQLATPKSVRLRDRYLGSAFSATYTDTAPASEERVVNRLRDRQLRPEEFSRFDARGDRLSIKL